MPSGSRSSSCGHPRRACPGLAPPSSPRQRRAATRTSCCTRLLPPSSRGEPSSLVRWPVLLPLSRVWFFAAMPVWFAHACCDGVHAVSPCFSHRLHSSVSPRLCARLWVHLLLRSQVCVQWLPPAPHRLILTSAASPPSFLAHRSNGVVSSALGLPDFEDSERWMLAQQGRAEEVKARLAHVRFACCLRLLCFCKSLSVLSRARVPLCIQLCAARHCARNPPKSAVSES